MRVVDAEHRLVGADEELRAHVACARSPSIGTIVELNGDSPAWQFDAQYSSGDRLIVRLTVHRTGEARPVVAHARELLEPVDHLRHPVRLGLHEHQLQVGEAVEHTADHHLRQRPAGEERVLHRQREDRREARRAVRRRTGAAVLTDRQARLLARRPHRVEHGIEEEGAARVQRRHHDPAEAVLLRPVDVLHREVDVASNDTTA